jgi:FAD binding domain
MNTGIGDAVDLSWKLTAVEEGWGGPELLDSFEAERRPVGMRNVAEASRNLGRMLSPRPDPAVFDDGAAGARERERFGRAFADAMRPEWFTLGMHLGYRYAESPICWPDGSAAPPDDPKTYVPTARPGHRAPHAWLADGRSTLDLFGRSFVLLALGADASAARPLLEAAGRRGLPMRFIPLDAPDLLALYERRLALVRPDGHVAWRGDAAPADPLAVIDRVRGAGQPTTSASSQALATSA